MGEDPEALSQRADRFEVCERVLKTIMDQANASTPERLVEATIQEDAADAKRRSGGNSGTRSRRLRKPAGGACSGSTREN